MKKDPVVQKSAIICLQETWHDRDKENDPVLEGFESHFNSGDHWKGNGIASFHKNTFSVNQSIWARDFQLTKMISSDIQIINIYYKKISEQSFLHCLKSLINDIKTTLLVGDFNIDFNSKEKNNVISWLESKNMVQVVDKASQIAGGLLDHVWVSKEMLPYIKIVQKGLFYSDHDMITVLLDRKWA